MGAVRKANALVKSFVESGENMDYINTFDAMIGPDGNPRAEFFLADGLHFNPTGNKVRADIIRPHLEP
jgi:lysophospholipase L1-like esterase